MPSLPVVLALSAGIGGAVSMILVATAPHNSSTLSLFAVALIITLGALSSAMRLSRQDRA